ncbi:hypothetical protein B0H16DRAFT_550152 [Mycena metata]|uniref:Uncharacterized protein n=1 Tax=Mycena metata TaxID=1033252 RepID=A0AAD7H691_9AGAR|nr:hypothetical protein B0H16DRAFT_550152 [Mycena metata]
MSDSDSLREVNAEILIYNLETAWSPAAAEICLYGAYFVLVAFYLHALLTRRMAKQTFLTIAIIALFILCTIHCAFILAATTLNNRIYVRLDAGLPFVKDQNRYSKLTLATQVVYVTSNVIADGIFIFRCYAIWNFRLKVVLLPIFMTLALAAFGYFTAIDAAAGSRFVGLNTSDILNLIELTDDDRVDGINCGSYLVARPRSSASEWKKDSKQILHRMRNDNPAPCTL